MLKKELELENSRLIEALAEVRAELLETQNSHKNLMNHLKTANKAPRAVKATQKDIYALASKLYHRCSDERAVMAWLKSVNYVVNGIKYFGVDIVKLLNLWYSQRISPTK